MCVKCAIVQSTASSTTQLIYPHPQSNLCCADVPQARRQIRFCAIAPPPRVGYFRHLAELIVGEVRSDPTMVFLVRHALLTRRAPAIQAPPTWTTCTPHKQHILWVHVTLGQHN